jgi:hypothetical protein
VSDRMHDRSKEGALGVKRGVERRRLVEGRVRRRRKENLPRHLLPKIFKLPPEIVQAWAIAHRQLMFSYLIDVREGEKAHQQSWNRE